jgi:hypothetical protein
VSAGPGDGPTPAGRLIVAIDGTLFRRWGRRSFAAVWTHDGATQGKHKIGRGDRWIVAGIVVRLPFYSSLVCLPVLFRLWRGRGTASHVDLAAELLALIIDAFPEWRVHGVGDAAYHGKALVTPRATWTTRLPRNATLYALAPGGTGKRGRPRLKGKTLGKPADLAATATWRRVAVNRYGRVDTIEVTSVPCIWYSSFGNAGPVRAGPRGRLGQAVRHGVVHPRHRHRWRPDRGALSRALVDRAVQRHQQAAHGGRAGPQPPAEGGAAPQLGSSEEFTEDTHGTGRNHLVRVEVVAQAYGVVHCRDIG